MSAQASAAAESSAKIRISLTRKERNENSFRASCKNGDHVPAEGLPVRYRSALSNIQVPALAFAIIPLAG